MIVVVGSINMDMVVQVPRPALVGETLLGSDYALHPGGKGGNQATAAARAGGMVRLIAKAGIDVFADTLIDSLAASGVDVHAVQRASRPSGVAFINSYPDGDNSIIVAPGANFDLAPGDLQPEMFEGATVVVLQLEVPLDTVLEAARLGRAAGAKVVLNLSPARQLTAAQLENVDLLLTNESEAALLTGRDNSEEALAGLLELVPMAVLTLGERGAAWATRDAGGRVPAHEVTAVDTTGAGDAFAGALAARLGDGATLEEAVRFGMAAGALAVTREGAQPSMPTADEIEEFLAR